MPGRQYLSQAEFEQFVLNLNRRLYRMEAGVSTYSDLVPLHATRHEYGGADEVQLESLQVDVSFLAGATYEDVQDYVNQFGQRTNITGMIISDNYDGSVAISAGTGWCKVSDGLNVEGKFFDFAGANAPALNDEEINYIYLDYNGGTPQIVIDQDGALFFTYDHIILGCVFRHGTHCHTVSAAFAGLDAAHTNKMHEYERAQGGERVSGLITSSTGTRNLSITAGVIYVGNCRETSLSFDTSATFPGTADDTEAFMLHDAAVGFTLNDVGKTAENTTDATFTRVAAFIDDGQLRVEDDIFVNGENYELYDSWHYWWTDDNGATWSQTDHSTQIDKLQWNNVGVGLANLLANRYGVHWLYIGRGGKRLQVVYGQGNYTASEAENAEVPALLPPVVRDWGILIAKIICRQNTDTLIISYPWTAALTTSLATDHGSLAGLSDVADHAYAFLHDGTRAMTGNLDMANADIINVDNIHVIDGSWIGLSVADERIEYHAAGYIALMGSLVGVGTITPTWTRTGNPQSAKFLVEGGGASSEESIAIRRENDALMPRMATLKARTGPAAVVNNDALFIMTFCGHDGTDYNQGAAIIARVDGAVAANTVPTELTFSTTETNSVTERLVITPAGDFDFKSGNLETLGDIAAVTAMFSVLSNGYVPYHVSDAVGLADSPISTDGTNVGIGKSPNQALDISGNMIWLDGSGNTYSVIDRSAANRRGVLCFVTAGDSSEAIPATGLQWCVGMTDSDDQGDGSEFFIGTTTPGSNYAILIDVARDIWFNGDLHTDRWLESDTNTFIGVDVAGAGNLAHGGGNEGWENTGFGHEALKDITTGYANTAIGSAALSSIISGIGNVAIGWQSLISNDTGSNNLAVGTNSLLANTSGARNVAIGYGTLQVNTTTNDNTGIGYYALHANDGGTSNTAIGAYSLDANTSGLYNTAVGVASLSSVTTGDWNAAVGIQSLLGNTTGSYNVAIGANAGHYQSDGIAVLQTPENSIYLGASAKSGCEGNAAATCDTIVNDTGIGGGDDGNYNGIATTKVGGNGDDNLTVDITIAGGVITVVAVNAAGMGYRVNDTITISGLSGSVPAANDDGTFDIASVGAEQGIDNEIVIGYNAIGHGSNTVTLGNTSITHIHPMGDLATDRWLSSDTNTFIGVDVAGSGNLAHGGGNEGWENTGFGHEALKDITTGYRNSAFGRACMSLNTTGYSNSAMGRLALHYNLSGYQNVALGYRAGAFQNDGLSGLETPENSTYLGADAKSGSDPAGGEDAITNEIVIGYNAVGHGSDTVTLGNSSITDTVLRGQVSMTGAMIQKFVVTTNNVDGNETHTVAVMLGGLIRRGTGDQLTVNRTDVSDTAANIVAAITNCIVGSGFEFSIANEDSTHTVALDGGVGVTMIPNDPSTAIPANSTGRFLAVVTNIGAATEAVDIHALGFSTH